MREITDKTMKPTGLGAVILVVALVGLASSSHVTAESIGQRLVYKPKPGDFTVVCTVFNREAPEATASTPTEPITFDPHFYIGARVERVTLGDAPWRAGDLVTFVVHSPVSLLGGAFSGQQFALTFSPFTPTTEDDKVWFEPETRYLLRWVEPVKPSRR